MTRYMLRRLLSGLLTLFIFLTVVFFVTQAILPGDYASQQSMFMTGPQVQALREQLGLDQPLMKRYVLWLADIARGDLGSSFTSFGEGPPVIDMLKSVVPPTLLVFGIGAVLAFLLGYWLGMVTGWRGPGVVSTTTTFSSIMLYTAFPPWLGFLLMYGLTAIWDRAATFSVINNRLWREAPLPQYLIISNMLLWVAVVTALVILINWLLYRFRRWRIPTILMVLFVIGGSFLAWSLTDWWVYSLEVMKRALIPLFTFTALSFGEIMLIMRTNMVDTLHDEYIITARAKGLRNRDVRSKHAARNALLPSLSRMVISIPYLLAGMVMIEQTLDWHGISTMLFDAMATENIPLWIGTVLVVGVISLVARFLLDILVAALDPRVRFATTTSEVIR